MVINFQFCHVLLFSVELMKLNDYNTSKHENLHV